MFPAQAGMNRRSDRPSGEQDRVPRAGGDEPYELLKDQTITVVFPAQAGMNRCTAAAGEYKPRVPRPGGDEPADC